MLSVTLKGADELDAKLDGLPAAVVAALAAKSAALANQLLTLVRSKLTGGVLQPRTGALAASIGVDGPRIEGDRVVTTLFAGGDVKYAAIQEYGGVTSPHDILPSRAKALAFLAGGEQVFAHIVHHPGSHIPERSYLRSSLAEMAGQIESELKAAVVDAIRSRWGLSMDVEPIYQALFSLTAGLSWPGGGALAFSSRRVKTFEDLPAQPALCQAETDETMAQVTSLQSVTTLSANWLIYHQAGRDDDAIPAQTTNAILSAVKALFVDPTDPDFAQTLGGVVHKCWIEGRIQKFQGDLDGQTLIVVPIKILVP